MLTSDSHARARTGGTRGRPLPLLPLQLPNLVSKALIPFSNMMVGLHAVRLYANRAVWADVDTMAAEVYACRKSKPGSVYPTHHRSCAFER